MGFKRLIKKKMNNNLNLLKVKIKRKVTFGNFPAGNLLARVIQYSEVNQHLIKFSLIALV
jgi:hypothetical protein